MISTTIIQIRLNRTFADTEQSLTNNQRTILINENDTLQPINPCLNCKRYLHPFYIASYSEDSIYRLHFSSICSTDIKNRKFKHKDVRTNGGEPFYNLCNECQNYLTIEEPNEYNKQVYSWPNFFIKLLENKEIHLIYKSFIWRFIPFSF